VARAVPPPYGREEAQQMVAIVSAEPLVATQGQHVLRLLRFRTRR
jgi:hypothetical protein